MILKHFMTTNPISVCPDDSIHRAAQIMAWTDSRHLPVTIEGDRLVGIVSERDVLAYRLKRPDNDPRSTPLSQAMHAMPQTAAPESSMTEAAARLAQKEIGCLPVTERGRLVGLVTRADVLHAIVQSAGSKLQTRRSAAELMTDSPITVGPADNLLDAAKLMQQAELNHLPVVDSGNTIVGILSNRDLSAVIGDHLEFGVSAAQELRECNVRDAMSRFPLTVQPCEGFAAIAKLFALYRASAVLVATTDETLQGIIAYIDLLRNLWTDHAPQWRHSADSHHQSLSE